MNNSYFLLGWQAYYSNNTYMFVFHLEVYKIVIRINIQVERKYSIFLLFSLFKSYRDLEAEDVRSLKYR